MDKKTKFYSYILIHIIYLLLISKLTWKTKGASAILSKDKILLFLENVFNAKLKSIHPICHLFKSENNNTHRISEAPNGASVIQFNSNYQN